MAQGQRSPSSPEGRGASQGADSARADESSPAPHDLRARMFAAAGSHSEAREEALLAHRLAPDDPAATLLALHETPATFAPQDVEDLARQAVRQLQASAEAHDL